MVLSSHTLGDALDSSMGLAPAEPSTGRLWREAERLQRFQHTREGIELDKPDPLSLELSEAT